jgi:hypothetical protein
MHVTVRSRGSGRGSGRGHARDIPYTCPVHAAGAAEAAAEVAAHTARHTLCVPCACQRQRQRQRHGPRYFGYGAHSSRFRWLDSRFPLCSCVSTIIIIHPPTLIMRPWFWRATAKVLVLSAWLLECMDCESHERGADILNTINLTSFHKTLQHNLHLSRSF